MYVVPRGLEYEAKLSQVMRTITLGSLFIVIQASVIRDPTPTSIQPSGMSVFLLQSCSYVFNVNICHTYATVQYCVLYG